MERLIGKKWSWIHWKGRNWWARIPGTDEAWYLINKMNNNVVVLLKRRFCVRGFFPFLFCICVSTFFFFWTLAVIIVSDFRNITGTSLIHCYHTRLYIVEKAELKLREWVDRNLAEFLAAGEACKDIFWSSPGLKEKIWVLIRDWGLICACSVFCYYLMVSLLHVYPCRA